jgi:hypothetical protein
MRGDAVSDLTRRGPADRPVAPRLSLADLLNRLSEERELRLLALELPEFPRSSW